MVDTSTYIAGAALILTGLGMIWTYFGGISSLRKEVNGSIDKVKTEHENTIKSLNEVLLQQSTRLTRMETKMELFWNAVGGAMSSLIKQPIHFRKDQLMDKLIPENLPHLPEATVEELIELKTILQDELVTLRETKENKSLAYALAIAYIDQILYDKGLIKGECH